MNEFPTCARWQPPGWRRSLQLALATAWLLDGVLQLQPFMFTHGVHGFNGTLAGTAGGNPQPVSSSIIWVAGMVGQHSGIADIAFALTEVLLGLGIAWRKGVKVALAASIPWSLGVWWFGEGLGGVLHGAGATVTGGPGAVLLYAVLAVILWPRDALAEHGGGETAFVATRGIGVEASKAVWAALWAAMALLSLLGGARAPSSVRAAIGGVTPGEPGWLVALDRHAAAIVGGRGLAVAVGIAAACLVVACGVYLPVGAARAALVLAIVTSLAIWVVTENFGMMLAGGATDPNSGPLLVLLALTYWPAGRPAPEPAVAHVGAAELAGVG